MKNQRGFGLVEVIILIVIVGLIGFGGWYVWQANNSSNKTADTGNTTTDPYKDWKTYTFKYEKFSLKYPAYLTVKDKSHTNEYVKPGADSVEFANADGFTLKIQTGLEGIGGDCAVCEVVDSEPITFLGQTLSLNYVNNDDGSTTVGYVVVTKNSDDWFGAGTIGKNIKSTSDNHLLPMSIIMSYTKDGEIVAQDLATLKGSDDFKDAIKVLKTASY